MNSCFKLELSVTTGVGYRDRRPTEKTFHLFVVAPDQQSAERRFHEAACSDWPVARAQSVGPEEVLEASRAPGFANPGVAPIFVLRAAPRLCPEALRWASQAPHAMAA